MTEETHNSDDNDDYLPPDQQEDSSDIENIDIFLKSRDVVTWSTDWTAYTVVDQVKRGVIDLNPKFQRRQAWDIGKRGDLILSLLTNIPIPQIVLAENPKQKGKFIVIDGKQRLMALAQFIGGGAEFEKIKLKLKGNKSLNGKYYSELEEEHKNVIDNAVIRTVVLKNINNEFLYSVFLKLNMGSSTLSPQELRQALVAGEFTDYVDDFAIRSLGLKQIMNIKNPDPRMRDTELALRYFAYLNNITKYNGNLKGFLDEFSETVNKNWEEKSIIIQQQSTEFEEAVTTAGKIFGKENISKKWNGKNYEKRLNRAIFDVIFYYFSNPNIREIAEKKSIEVVTAFKHICVENTLFKEAVESSTKNIERTQNRIVLWGEALKEIIGESVIIPNFQQVE